MAMMDYTLIAILVYFKGDDEMEYTVLGFGITLIILLSVDAIIGMQKGVI